MTYAHNAHDEVGRIRDAAVATSPGPQPDTVSLKGLRLPPATRAAMAAAIQMRCSWGPIPGKAVPSNLKAMAQEIERDISLLAHEMALEPRLSPAFARYLGLLAEGLGTLHQAYARRLAAGAGAPR